MAKENSLITVIHKDGETVTHFNRQSFLKQKADKEGYRSGWKPYDGEAPIPSALTGQGSKGNNANVPEVLKTFKSKSSEGVSEDEVQRRIQIAVEKDRAARNRKSSEGAGDKSANGEEKKNSITDLPDTTNATSEKADELKDVQTRVEKNDPVKTTGGNTSKNTADNTRNK